MDALEYEQELENLREWLAESLGREDVPDAVWGRVMKLGLAYEAITGGVDERQALVEAAKLHIKELRDESEGFASTPSREERGAPQEITVELSEYSRKRAQAFSEVAVALAENHPKVKRFRRRYLRDRLLTNDEAAAFFENQGGPYGTGHVLKKLRKLANRLVKTYRWREGDAMWFVLTGHVPPVRPVKVRVAVSESINDYHPSTAEIWLTADAWVDAKEVEQAFRNAQRQVLGGDARPLPDRTLEAATFIARRMREHGKEAWRERWEAWNKTCPKEWRYDSYRGLRQVFERFTRRMYNWPKYKQLHEPTPYQMWRDKWVRGGTGKADTG